MYKFSWIAFNLYIYTVNLIGSIRWALLSQVWLDMGWKPWGSNPRSTKTGDEHCTLACLLSCWGFYILVPSKAISGRTTTCDSDLWQCALMASCCQTKPPEPSPEFLLSRIVLIMNYSALAYLRKAKCQLCKSLTSLSLALDSRSSAGEACALPIRTPCPVYMYCYRGQVWWVFYVCLFGFYVLTTSTLMSVRTLTCWYVPMEHLFIGVLPPSNT